MVAVVRSACVLIVTHAPLDPLEQQLAGLRPQEYRTGEEMRNCVHGDTELW